MRIGACQTPEILADPDRALSTVREFAAADAVDLLLFPECFLPGYLVTDQHVREQALALDSPEFARVPAALADLRPMIVLGVIEADGGDYFNTAVVIARGELIGRYRKTHLVPGEAVFTAGDGYPVFDCEGVRFGMNICYDMQFPEAAAGVAAAGAQILLTPAQNMMGRDKASYWEPRHNEIRGQRARETGLWIASADVTGERGESRIGLGPTAFLDPAGTVVAQVPTGVTGMVTADFDGRVLRGPRLIRCGP
jgi:predicted amidohydrolase